jgi:hypothetical protein
MEIEAVGRIQGGVPRFSSDEHAVQFGTVQAAQHAAMAERTAELANQGVQATTDSANVVTSARYSPALYAQAAQFQLFAQSGVLSAIAQQGATPATVAPNHDHPNEISAVGGVRGSRVDAKA